MFWVVAQVFCFDTMANLWKKKKKKLKTDKIDSEILQPDDGLIMFFTVESFWIGVKWEACKGG